MADSNLTDLFDSATIKRAPRRFGKMVPCDECGVLHYRKATRLVRTENPRRSHPTSGKWLCSKACGRSVAKKSHILSPCLQCGKIVERRRSHVKQSVFCSKECTNSFGRTEIGCCWPGCETKLVCRTFEKTDRRGVTYTTYKTEMTREGSFSKYVTCAGHKRLFAEFSGSDGRVTNGRVKLLNDPTKAYDTRGASSRFLRFVIFDRANSRCEKCVKPLKFQDGRKSWQVDHVVPVYLGGATRVDNLQLLCHACHDEKTSVEKADAGRRRHTLTKLHRWKTHLQKDELIARLRAQIVSHGLRPVD